MYEQILKQFKGILETNLEQLRKVTDMSPDLVITWLSLIGMLVIELKCSWINGTRDGLGRCMNRGMYQVLDCPLIARNP